MNQIEKDVESCLEAGLHRRGGLCWKFTSPGRRGVPDRWCAYNGLQFFAEIKAPTHKKRKDEALQKEIHKKISRQGVKVYVLETKEDVALLLRFLDVGILPEETHFGKL